MVKRFSSGTKRRQKAGSSLRILEIPQLQSSPSPRPLLRQPVAVAALLWLLGVSLGAVLAPYLAPKGPEAADISRALLPPGRGGLLGTDFMGRDIFGRLLWGGRLTLLMGVQALALGIGVGLPLGLAAGSFGGRTDTVIMRFTDAWLAFPSLILSLAVLAILGRGLSSVTVAVGLAAAAPYARIVRTTARAIRAQPYIDAAVAVGASPLRIALRHVLPNAIPALAAYAAVQFGQVLLHGASLNYMGLGGPPGTPEWGTMLAAGRDYLRVAPWAATFPGLILTFTVLAVNLLGDRIQMQAL